MTESAKVAFIGLNPGGSGHTPGHGELSCENGSAYEVESWAGFAAGEAPLQLQVKALFRLLETSPANALAGNLVPFRSRSWADLAAPEDAVRFGLMLWADLLHEARPNIVVTMGAAARQAIFGLLATSSERCAPAGWEPQRVRWADGVIGPCPVRLIGVPHLSRFRIATRACGQEALRRASQLHNDAAGG